MNQDYYIYQNNEFTLIFNSCLNECEADIIEELKFFNIENNYTNKYYYLTYKSNNNEQKSLFNQLLNNERFRTRLEILLYDYDGKITFENNKNRISNELENEIISVGLLNLIKNEKAIMFSNESFHYVHPSGKHAKYFIRLANVLKNKSSIFFFSFSLLKYLKHANNKEIIYYDTSSIISIIIGLEALLQLFNKKYDFKLIGFESYDGINKIKFLKESLVLISASNSEDLANIIQDLSEKITTLNLVINYPSERIKSNFLVNIYEKISGIESKRFDNEFECEYCRSGSIPIKFEGDQFLPLKPIIKELLLSTKCMPGWIEKFMDQFVEKKIIYCNKIENNKTRELYLDLDNYHSDILKCFGENLESEDEYINRLKWYLDTEISINIKGIVHLEDNASKSLAGIICKYLEKKSITPDKISETEIDNYLNRYSSIDVSSFLIVTSCCSTGHRLLKISSQFRNYPKINISYLIGIQRLIDKKHEKELMNSLEHRSSSKLKNKIFHLQQIYLPNNHSKHSSFKYKSVWQKEFIEIRNLIIRKIVEDSKDILKNRINELELISYNEIFWKNPIKDEKLILKRNFAFYRFEKKYKKLEEIPQSEVFFVIQSMLHHLRCKSDLEERLLHTGKKHDDVFPLIQDGNIRTLLSPSNFERFNDGIIQSSILRASINGELNYSVNLDLSYKMRMVLENIFDSELNEAIIEFLLAIFMRNLTLNNADLKELIIFTKSKFESNPTIMLFIEMINIRFSLCI